MSLVEKSAGNPELPQLLLRQPMKGNHMNRTACFIVSVLFLGVVILTAELPAAAADASTDSQVNAAETVLATATNNGTGRWKSGGGTTANLILKDLKDDDVLNFRATGGNFGYVTIHGRTSRGSWSILYRGPARPMSVKEVLKNQRSRYTHLIVQVNGEHERYQRRACQLDVVKIAATSAAVADAGAKTPDTGKAASNASPSTPTVTTEAVVGTAVNNGSGTGKAGGSTVNLILKDLKDDDVLNFRVSSGSFGYVTIHGRTSWGSWSVLYRGPIRPMTVKEVLKNQRSRFTHLIVQVNGEHERYQRRMCRMDVVKMVQVPVEASRPATADGTSTTPSKPTAPQAIVPPTGVVQSSTDSMPMVNIRASKEFSTTGQGPAAEGGVQTYVDLKLYFDSKTGSVTARDGATTKPVILRDAEGHSITVTSPGELQSSSWRVVVDDNSVTDGWILARTTHF